MIEKNVQYLKESLKYLGFGEKLNADLENAISLNPEKFKLVMPGEFDRNGVKDEVKFTLHFKRSDKSEMYFFNSYDAALKNAEDPTKEKSQTFYINKNSGVTAKEAYNLLSGRAVYKDLNNKEGQEYNAWIQLDFGEKDKNENFKIKQYHQNYGYELANELKKYPIKELDTEADNLKLLKSLEKGNLTQVTFVKEGKDERMFIEANPQFKNITVYDAQMKKAFQGIERKEKSEPEKSKSNDKKESEKQATDDEDSPKRGRKRKNGVKM